MKFLEKVMEMIRLWEDWLPDPEDDVQMEDWSITAETIMDSFCFDDTELPYVEKLLTCYEEQKEAILHMRNARGLPSTAISQEELDELLSRKQLEQRTPEWYQQMATIISASELGSLFGAKRQRAKLVISKTVPAVPRYQPLAVLSNYMSAFDWGIRFEPVVKQIYQHMHGVTIKELGRLHHPDDPRCTASPDGLIYHCPKQQRTGHLIEIKCPVTREIDGTVPKDYYAQMQMQLHVTGRPVCEYVEAVFSSAYNNLEVKSGPSQYSGYIALIRYAEVKEGQEFYYQYSPLHVDSDWCPSISSDEEVVEITPWRLYQWSEQRIQKNDEWWKGIRPIIDTFWEDVEKAKRGEFVIPESTRAPKASKDTCRIQFHRLDENGEPIGAS
jgi:putative phage-type endonuclease